MRDLFPSYVARAEGRYMAYFSGDVKKKKKITLKENASTVQISLVFFFNILCWHWWYQQGSRLFNYVSFSKSHVELVVHSEY